MITQKLRFKTCVHITLNVLKQNLITPFETKNKTKNTKYKPELVNKEISVIYSFSKCHELIITDRQFKTHCICIRGHGHLFLINNLRAYEF